MGSIRLGALLLFSAVLSADPIVLDFESLTDLETVTGQIAGLSFTNTVAVAAGISLNEFEFPPRSGSIVVSDNFGPIEIAFATPVVSFGGFFTYLVPVRLSAYDSADALVGSTMSLFATNLAVSGDPASAPNELIQISFGGGISRVLIEGDSSGASFTLDDATYEHLAVSEVPDTIPPTVISAIPADGATGVAVNTTISATFSEAMNPSTITRSTFTLRQGTTPVSGTVTYRGRKGTFTPASVLAPLATFTATITTGINGAEDLAGNVINSPYIWNFTTAATKPSPVIDPPGTSNDATGTVNAASYVTPVAAGSIAAVFGSNLSVGESDPQVATPLRDTLAESSFTIGGRVAPLFFASPGQVNLQIPWALAGLTQAPIQATVDGETSNTQMVSLAPLAPGIFTMDATGTGQGAILIAPTDQLATPEHPVVRGEYISIFCTGLGAVTNEPATGAPALATPLSFTLTMPTLTIGGAEAVVSYAGLAPGFAGLYQVNAIVPEDASPGNAVPVVLSIGGVTSNTVTIAVQ